MARRRRSKREDPPLPSVDLHGKNREEALRALRHALHTWRVAGTVRALVITGRGMSSASGEAVLAPAVEAWLRSPEGRQAGALDVQARALGGAFEVRVGRPDA